MPVGLSLDLITDRRRAVQLLGCPPDLFDRLVPDVSRLTGRERAISADHEAGTLVLHGHRISWTPVGERQSIAARLGGLAQVAADTVRTGQMLAADQVVADREAICRDCAHRQGTKCGQCGCLISLKTRAAAAKCPLDRW
jgi:hypothetical protein